MIQYSFNWKQLSVMAGVSFYRFYFRLFPGAVRAPQCVEFLKALRRQIRGKLLIIWDGLTVHKSRLVRQFVEDCDIQLETRPAYAPELNPVEYLFGYFKPHELGNFCPHDMSELSDFARCRLRSMQHRPTLIAAFWKQAELPL